MLEKLPRKRVIMDRKGRLTIPDYMREAFGLTKGEDAFLTIEAYPNLEECKTIFIKRE